MPVEINGFQCEKCKHVHIDFDSAQKCELQHGSNFEYTLEFERGKTGPAAIKCSFAKENGDLYERHYY